MGKNELAAIGAEAERANLQKLEACVDLRQEWPDLSMENAEIGLLSGAAFKARSCSVSGQ
ncbi:MAG: hypothetical protein ABSH34_17185 [Verrucomicrobiota bacterium]